MEESKSVKRRMKLFKLQSKARRGRIRITRLYKFSRFLLVVGIFYFCYLVIHSSHWFFPTNYRFDKNHSERLEIVGNSIVPDKKILSALSGLKTNGIPIYKQNPSEIKKKIEDILPVKRAFVRRYWFPARYVVMVEERTPLLLIAPSETSPAVAMYTSCGKFIGREYLPLTSAYDTTLILSYGTQGDDYEDWKEDKIHLLDKLSKTITKYSGERVSYIDLRQPRDVYVQLPSVLIRLGDLDYTVFKRVEYIKSILPQIKKFNEKVKYVDLRWADSRYLKLKHSENKPETENE
ncbi:FtsQ-type POTRA domain-containing protein [bacterium]|nr:FtsQ-type POTRA domain-containing protein [bacterium]